MLGGIGGRRSPPAQSGPKARDEGWVYQTWHLLVILGLPSLQDYIVHFSCVAYCMLLLLLLSHFSRVRLCVTPEMAAHQAPPSLGFSRQEHWSGLPFPSPKHESEKRK